MVTYMQQNNVYRAWTWMGAFGKSCPKGTTLISSHPDVVKLCRPLPSREWKSEMTKKTVSHGKVSVSGGKDLKKSQSYTHEFGMAVLSTWLGLDPQPPRDLGLGRAQMPADVWGYLPKKYRWEDARLRDVFQYLTLGA